MVDELLSLKSFVFMLSIRKKNLNPVFIFCDELAFASLSSFVMTSLHLVLFINVDDGE